jgi:hypothetical protein
MHLIAFTFEVTKKILHNKIEVQIKDLKFKIAYNNDLTEEDETKVEDLNKQKLDLPHIRVF